MSKPLVLVTNDDGVDAQGIGALAEALRTVVDVQVVAPSSDWSGASHSISLARPLSAARRDNGDVAIGGTPVDCVYLALLEFCSRPPDVIVSGINFGHNLGADMFYSGTVGAALEGAIRGIPSMAVSLEYSETDLAVAADFAVSMLPTLLGGRLPPRTLLNVNLPRGRPKAFRMTRMGFRQHEEMVEVRKGDDGRDYYWIGGRTVQHTDGSGADYDAIDNGLIAVTPIGLDMTQRVLLEELSPEVAGFVRQP